MFKNKTILITGGTGSFGNAFLDVIIEKFEFKEIRIFSRDEKKQDDLRKKLNNKKVKFFIGDVRDKESIKSATIDCNYIFHAAALKQVPSCEFFPLEAIKTNILGTENVIDSAIINDVERVVCLSTDKSVYPINSMGLSKALMEKVIVSKARSLSNKKKTKICITRYGNVIGSRGSVIPLFLNQIKNNKPITATDLNMTRFMMTMSEAIELVLYAFTKGDSGEIFIRKTCSATIKNIINAIKSIYERQNYQTKLIGIRHGEKMHETLMSAEEKIKAKDKGNFYIIPYDKRDLNYDTFFIKGSVNSSADNYSSDNVKQLNISELKTIILNYQKNNNFDQ